MQIIYISTGKRIGVLPFLFLAFLLVSIFSCKKFIQIDPPTSSLVRETVFKSDATATAAITAIYHLMQEGGFACGSSASVTSLGALSADELVSYSLNGSEFYQNQLTAVNAFNLEIWSSAYNTIYNANAVLDGLAGSDAVSATVRDQLRGEAKFIRAFSYFYLVNLYGDIPLITTTDFRSNATASRISTTEVYQLIIDDLKQAQELLPEEYLVSLGGRTRPNKGAATALLARVYLYRTDWKNAEIQATAVIGDGLYDLITDLDKVFLTTSNEAIWQLLPVDPRYNTWEGYYFILEAAPTTPNIQAPNAFSDQLINTFEAGDKRFTHWVANFNSGSKIYYYPFKYKVKTGTTLTESSMVMRLAEQYLIRAEARAQQDKIAGAREDINAIRDRAGLSDTDADTKEELLSAVMQEKRIELMTEWGHRWLDLKRTGRADAVLGPVKGSNWKSTDVLYPIPQNERLNNPKLSQNSGY